MNDKQRILIAKNYLAISHCTLCSSLPSPPTASPSPPKIFPECRLLIIGEQPATHLHAWPAQLKSVLTEYINTLDLKEREIGWANVVSCRTYKPPMQKPPSKDAMAMCRGHLLRTLEAANPQLVLLAGGNALSSWRPDLSVSTFNGHMGRWSGKYTTTCTFHPAAVFRDPGVRHQIGQTFENIWAVLSGADWRVYRRGICNKCKNDGRHEDADGIAYCGRHWKTNGGDGRKGVKKWKTNEAMVKQPKMF